MDTYIFAALFALLTAMAVLCTVFSSRAAEKKTERKLEEQFGDIPDNDGIELESIRKPWDICGTKNPLFSVDATTWNDLDMDEVYKRLDSCETSLGEEYLYSLLHRFPDAAETERREALIELFDQNPGLRLRVQMLLHRLGKRTQNGLFEFIGGARTQAPGRPWVYKVLAVLPALLTPLIFFSPAAGTVSVLMAACANILISFFVGKRIELDGPSVRYFSAILTLCCNLCKIKDESFFGFRKELLSALTPLKRLRGTLSDSIRGSLLMNEMDTMMELGRMVSLSQIRSYNKAVRMVSNKREACKKLCDLVSGLDTAIAILSFRKSLSFCCKPHFIGSMKLNIQDVCHPLLQNAVPNSAVFDKSAVITGSNASGKSTFMKAVAVNGILAVSLNTCSARVYQAPRIPVISSMAVRDSITAGESYYISEIKSLRRVLERVSRTPCLCFVDEILKGTNTAERIAASAAILQYLCQKNCLCLVATHDIELTQILGADFENYHFSEQITDRDILFDYRIKPGPSRTTNAVRLLSYFGFDGGIVSRAENLAALFARTGGWEDDETPEQIKQ